MKFKRPLVLVLVLALAMSAVTGGTIAWFTDEVTSSSNKIASGNLDIVLEYKDALTDNWTEVEDGSDPLFNYNLWEPGYTEYKYFRISNAGSLALKYRLHLNVDPSTEAQAFNLADVIDVYMLPVTTTEVTRADIAAATPVGVLSALSVENDGAAHGNMLAGEAAEFCIALKMQESAGNDYQNLSVGNGFALRLEATQYTHETDGFGTNDYDAGAALSSYVDSVEDLQQALAEGGNITLIADVETEKTITIPAGAFVTLNLNGNTITGKMAKDDGAVLNNEGSLNVVGGTLRNTTVNGDAVIDNKGTLVLDGTVVTGAPIGDSGYPAYAVYTAGKLTVEDGTTISSDRGAIIMSNGADVVINGGNIEVTDAIGSRVLTSHVIYAYGKDSKLTINDGDFSQKYAAAGNTGASVICPAGATINVYDGNFSYAGTVGQSGVFQNYMGYGAPVNVYGGTYSDKTVEENIADGYKSVSNGSTFIVVSDDDSKVVEATSQDDLNAASKEAGSTILLNEGTYEFPSIAEGVTIIGEEGVVFNDTLSGTLNNTTIKGVEIKASNAQRWAYSKGDLLFEDCTFDATGVYAIHYDGLNGANITYKNCKIVGWAAIGSGANSLTFDGCEIYGNGSYGLIRVYSDATIKNCTFDVANVNTTDVYQDGIHAVDCNVIVENCTNANGTVEDLLNVSGTGKITVK